MRWTIGIVIIVIGLWVIAVNWLAFILSITVHKHHSQVPLIGASFGALGLLIIPVKMPHVVLYLAPFFLDCGTLMLMVWGIWESFKKTKAMLVKRMMRGKG
jgi:hypothetical protein